MRSSVLGPIGPITFTSVQLHRIRCSILILNNFERSWKSCHTPKSCTHKQTNAKHHTTWLRRGRVTSQNNEWQQHHLEVSLCPQQTRHQEKNLSPRDANPWSLATHKPPNADYQAIKQHLSSRVFGTTGSVGIETSTSSTQSGPSLVSHL